jgi:hypothetical protein
MTIGSFVCSKCSGVLRGITPPHRIKSISMSSFTNEEIESIRTRGQKPQKLGRFVELKDFILFFETT